MPDQFVDKLYSRSGDELIRELSDLTGEHAEDVRKGLEVAVRAVLQGLLRMQASDGFPRAVMDTFRQALAVNPDPAALTNSLGQEDARARIRRDGATIISTLFGTAESGIVDLVAGEGGLRTSSAASLLNVTAVLGLAVIQAESGNRLTSGTLADWLNATAVRDAGASFQPIDQHIAQAIMAPPSNPSGGPPAQANSRVLQFVPWVILILVSLGLFYLVQEGCG